MKKIFLSFYLFVLITLAVLEFGFSPIVGMLIQSHIEGHLARYYRDLTKGTYDLLQKELQRHPQGNWPQTIAGLQPRFGYPISLISHEQIELSPQEREQLFDGQIVVRGDGDQFHQRIGQGDLVLTLGPFPEFKANIVALEISLWASVIILLGLITLIWVVPFYRRLNSVSDAALAFGNGDFSRRAQLPHRSALAPLATAFNNMADRIQQLIKSHKQLTSAVSHELRTPIARIRFGMQMIADAGDPAERHEHITGIRRDVDELEDLVTELLEYARFDRERPPLDVRSYPLNSWLQAIVSASNQAHTGIGVRLKATPSAGPVNCMFDARYLNRAVTNLLHNARRYARQRITVSLRTHPGHVAITVDDDGPGIPVNERKKIFDPFVRLDESRSRESGGYGLGLAIVRQVARWHDGRVTASASPDGGARFTIEWPRRPREDTHTPVPENRIEPAEHKDVTP